MVYMPDGDKPIIKKPIVEEIPIVKTEEVKTEVKKKGRPKAK